MGCGSGCGCAPCRARQNFGGAFSIGTRGFNPQPEPPRGGMRGRGRLPPDPIHARNLSRWQLLGRVGGRRALASRAGMFGAYADPEGPVTCPEGWIVDAGGGCTELGTGERVPEGLPPGFVAPGAVPVRVENWELDHQPYATYRIAGGDTFVGLAATYLGDGARWRDIWNTGDNKRKFPSPDDIRSTGPLDMPHEARDKMIAWLKLGKKGKPGELTEKQVAAANDKTKYWIAAGVATIAAAGLGVALYYRRKPRRAA